MSDLVGNPEDRFSCIAAQVLHAIKMTIARFFENLVSLNVSIIEPRREKTGLRGFRPGPT